MRKKGFLFFKRKKSYVKKEKKKTEQKKKNSEKSKAGHNKCTMTISLDESVCTATEGWSFWTKRTVSVVQLFVKLASVRTYVCICMYVYICERAKVIRTFKGEY